ncbi:MAG TPA: 50S ribosomal protein L1 [Candidatus Levybacteria bacterium]|nr:50S ribosomal protein L1 [Candidatus Levybacteria bacterium]
MGKVRVKTFDESGQLQDDKKRAKYEAKKAAKRAEASPEVETSPEEAPVVVSETEATTPQEADAPKKTVKAKFAKDTRSNSKRYKSNTALVDKNRTYTVKEAVETLKKFKTSKFDETIELHLNVTEKGISGQVTLPHGTGKKLRIVVADDAVIEEIESGKINFDVLVAKPEQMPKLAKVARVLGPRGLMPNPKNGTVTSNPDEVIAKLSAGQMSYKTEAKDPIMHLSVGKISFEEKKLEENVQTMLTSVGTAKIKSATLKSTMSPGIKISC